MCPDLEWKGCALSIDALYFRVSSDRQTTENQFEDLVQIAEKDDSGRDWKTIRSMLERVVLEEDRSPAQDGGRIVYRVDPAIAAELAGQFLYVEQGRSGKRRSRRRPMFERLRREAAARKFNRLLVWKVSRLGRDMREVIATVYGLADAGIEVFPVKSQTGPINSTLGRLLWAIQAWFAEMENEERSEAVKAGQRRALVEGRRMGRPRRIFDRDEVLRMRKQGKSWSQIARTKGIGATTARRVWSEASGAGEACQNDGESAVHAFSNSPTKSTGDRR